MELLSKRVVAVVLGGAVAMPWIQGSAEAPSPGRSCERFDGPTGRGGREGEPHDYVFARSGFELNWHVGILFCRSQMIKIWIHRWNEKSNKCDF